MKHNLWATAGGRMKKYFAFFALAGGVCFSMRAAAIIDGYLPTPNDPMAARTAVLFRVLNDGRLSTCTVALLDGGFAVTAAHCVAKLAQGEVWFVNNFSDLKNARQAGDFTRRRKVLGWQTPEAYSKDPSPANDIAVLRFEGEAPGDTSTFQMPVEDNLDSPVYFVAGYGSQTQLEEKPDGLLRVANLFASSRLTSANDAYLSFDQARGGGACAGDSGAPLAVEKDCEIILVGVVGGGLGIDRHGTALELKDACRGVSVFPSLHFHRDWILEAMERIKEAH